MTEKEFVIWLHGFLEISGAKTLDENQLQVIKYHLSTFFIKITPERKEKEQKQDNWSKKIADLEKFIKDQQDKPYPIYPVIPQYPIVPIYPSVGHDVIYCSDNTGTPLPKTPQTYC